MHCETTPSQPSTERHKTILLTVFLLIAAGVVILPFVKGLAWAIILVVSTWPLFLMLRSQVKSSTWSAALMCLAVVAIVLIAIVPMVVRLSHEARAWLDDQSMEALRVQVRQMVDLTQRIPIVGTSVHQWALKLTTTDEGIRGLAQGNQGSIVNTLSSAAAGFFGALTTLVSMIVFAFFIYRDGESMGQGACKALKAAFGRYGDMCSTNMVSTIRGTVLGVVVTAVVQGGLATVGYLVAGAPFPFLLGFATMVLAFLPFGAPLVYVPVSGYLLTLGQGWFWGVALLVWGVGVVSTSDNFLRPLFISRATKISMLYVLIGVLGGVITMGMLGLFIGPVIMALAADIIPKIVGGESPQVQSS